jgi:hypothetical protein
MEAGTDIARTVSFDTAPSETLRTGNAPVVTNMVLVEKTSRHDDIHASQEVNHTCNIVHIEM